MGSWFGVSAGKQGDVAQLVEHLLCKHNCTCGVLTSANACKG
jgi:hypothetical protein